MFVRGTARVQLEEILEEILDPEEWSQIADANCAEFSFLGLKVGGDDVGFCLTFSTEGKIKVVTAAVLQSAVRDPRESCRVGSTSVERRRRDV